MGIAGEREKTVPHIAREFWITKTHCLISELTFVSYTFYYLFFRVSFMCRIFFTLPSGEGHLHSVAAAASINSKLLKKLKLNPITLAGLELRNS